MLTEQKVLHSTPPTNGGNRLAFPSAEIEVVLLYVSVASLNILKQAALGMFLVTKEFVGADIVGKDGEKQRVFAVLTEEGAETHEISSK